MRTRNIFIAFVLPASLCCSLIGCSKGPEPSAQSHTIAQGSISSFSVLYEAWENDPKEYDLVRGFAELARFGSKDEDFQLFTQTESAFASLSESQREHELAEIMEKTKQHRLMFKMAIDQAIERAQEGNTTAAQGAMNAMRRVSIASNVDGQLAIGQLVAKRSIEWIDDATKKIETLPE